LTSKEVRAVFSAICPRRSLMLAESSSDMMD
jgi:hypothetical protein